MSSKIIDPNEELLQELDRFKRKIQAYITHSYPDYILFILAYLNKKRSHKEKFTQTIFNINGIKFDISDLKNNTDYTIWLDINYIELERTKDYYYLQLTEGGVTLAETLEYDKHIFLYNIPIRLILLLGRSIRGIFYLIYRCFELLIRFLDFAFIKNLKTTITILAGIVTITLGVLKLLELLNNP